MSQHAWPKDWICPDWPVANNVRACVTTATQGHSQGAYAHFNLAEHVGDDSAQVLANRQQLANILGCTPVWLDQVHGVDVAQACSQPVATADASVTRERGVACTIMTADCLPVLLATRDGSCVGAAHAGWRGLLAGVLENTAKAMDCEPQAIQVWLGPAIGAQVYEVGPEVREKFLADNPVAAQAFQPSAREEHWFADLYCLARLRLQRFGIKEIYGGGFCTLTDTRFYSYRRQSQTGRFASLIWLE